MCACHWPTGCTVTNNSKTVIRPSSRVQRQSERSANNIGMYLIAVGRRLQCIDADDLLEPVDLNQDEGVLENGGG